MFRSVLKCVFVVCACLVTFASAGYDESTDWDDQDPELTKEIEQLTQRPHPYLKTPPGYFPCTEVSPPEHYYEAEYRDKPCQDRAEWKIQAGAAQKAFDAKSGPKIMVDQIEGVKVSEANKFEQGRDTKNDDEVVKPMPIGDNVKVDINVEEIPNKVVAENKGKDEQINLKDLEEGLKVPIGDNVEANEIVEKYAPIGDNLKENNGQGEPREEPKDIDGNRPKLIGDNVQFHVDGVEASNANTEQVNMKDAINEKALDENERDTDQRLNAILNAFNPDMNMRKLYNIAEETPQEDPKDIKVENNAHDGKIEKKTEPKLMPEEKTKICRNCNKPINDIQIKIKLETIDEPKEKLSDLPNMNGLFGLERKALGGFDQFQNMMNRMMPLAKNVLNSQNSMDERREPHNFYMKYLQIDPSGEGLKYQYYYYQKYVNSRYNSGASSQDSARNLPVLGQASHVHAPKSPIQDSAKAQDAAQLEDSNPSLLMGSLLSRLLNPLSMSGFSPLTLLRPLSLASNRERLPLRIYMNEKSAAKYAVNLNRMDGLEKVGRVKRNAKSTTTEFPLFNEGPFKVEDPSHLAWARDFLKSFPMKERPTTFHIIHQQPTSEHPLAWYHPPSGEAATYYTVVPTKERVTVPGEDTDLCDCCHGDKTRPQPCTRKEDLVFQVGDKDPDYPEEN